MRLLAGPAPAAGAETWAAHLDRLGRTPRGGEWILDLLRESGLRGRGGAWFPTERKVARALERRGSHPLTLVVNGSEGEPLSAKDRWLLDHRPHLVLDGALILAATLDASEVIVYLSRPAWRLLRQLRHAVRERRCPIPVRFVAGRHRYIAGESSAAASRVFGGPAKPTGNSPPRVLVQNAETVAHVALLARHGAPWFRETGTAAAPGTALLTISGNVARPGVHEIGVGESLAQALDRAGCPITAPAAVLVGGYAGSWLAAEQMDRITLDPDSVTLGCGIVHVLPRGWCGVRAAATIATYMARESAGHCGPCVHGLGAIAGTMVRVARGDADAGDIARIQRWCAQADGRGACHHPDGAVHNLRTALETFSEDVGAHLRGHACADRGHALPAPTRRGWR